jgi:hypothetical protein
LSGSNVDVANRGPLALDIALFGVPILIYKPLKVFSEVGIATSLIG